MSLIRKGYAVSTRGGFLGALFSALLALALLHPGPANPDKPDPKVEAQAGAIAKKSGFASLAEYEDASMNIAMIMYGIDTPTKKFMEPSEQIKKEIAALKGDQSVPEAEKREGLAQLEAALKDAKPVQFKQNIALVLKYFDRPLCRSRI